MSEQTPQSGNQSTDGSGPVIESVDAVAADSDDSTEPYDAAKDQDADPDSLQPRTGGQAAGGTGDSEGDPDADADMLNPRDDSASSQA